MTERPADFLAPFWRRLDAAPVVDTVAAADLPAGFRALLDHTAGMTGTLADHWGVPLRVRRLAQWEEDRRLARLVALESGAVTAAIAAIRVELDALPASVHAGMVGSTAPFGRLLDEAGVRHRAEPLAFLRADADAALAGVAGVAAGAVLWGRYGSLLGEDGRVLCRALELLPRA
ncbi:hypothetical protein [Azospirillum halopraeferens]|uniref:hypothetical protein n=1 Tax=Azospirillum halopraeferens TaxID=34010 RepID=UPI00042965B1|nr:hypothetical protein [Azospirillum halopraeferens]